MSLIELADKNNIPYQTLVNRIRAGWDKERAATEPLQNQGYKAWESIAKKHGISRSTFEVRVYRYGWSKEKAATKPTNRRRMSEDFYKWLPVSKANGIKFTTYYKRVKEHGWSCEKAATKPVRKVKNNGLQSQQT